MSVLYEGRWRLQYLTPKELYRRIEYKFDRNPKALMYYWIAIASFEVFVTVFVFMRHETFGWVVPVLHGVVTALCLWQVLLNWRKHKDSNITNTKNCDGSA